MAKPAKKSETKVTRIKASDTQTKKTAKPARAASAKKAASEAKPRRKLKLGRLAAIGAYFKGAWDELRLVRWPDRKATWGMTGALIAFTAFFVVVIVLLDAGFSYLFKLIIGTN